MSVNTPVYATREMVKRALDYKETAQANERVDRAIETASRTVEACTHRTFYPQVATRYFDWPSRNRSQSFRLWLDASDLISATTVVSGSDTLTSDQYFLEPANYGPPFTHVEINLGSNAAFSSGDSHQRAIAITGLWGYRDDEANLGTLDSSLSNSATTVGLARARPEIGGGSLLRVDDERLLVNSVSIADSNQDTTGSLTASMSDVTVPVTDGSSFTVDESILIESERMLVTSVAGNDLTVKRAWDGSVLAAHNSGASVFSRRTLNVTRGAVGSTAASHDSGDSVGLWIAPAPVRDLSIAEAVNQLLQESGGYSRVVGSGDNAIEASGKGLSALRSDVQTNYGRKVRVRGTSRL